jgi:uncharacterized protein YkwD
LSPVDVAVLALVGVAVWSGFRSGFVVTMYSLASWILAAAAAIALTGPASGIVEAVTGLPPPLAASVGFVAVIIAAELLLAFAGSLAIGPIVRGVRSGPLNTLDRVLGTIPSAARSLFVVAVAVVAIETLPLGSEIKAAVETSQTGRIVAAQTAAFQPQLEALSGQLGGTPLLVTKIGEDETTKLELPDDLELLPDPVAERQLVDLVNEERAQRGLVILTLDDRLVAIARDHSREMFVLKYFGHDSPVAGSPFDRLAAGAVSYTRAGENLAYAQSVAVAHRGLMDSPGHRENILRPEFTKIGIGVISAGAYGRMVTQLFITP